MKSSFEVSKWFIESVENLNKNQRRTIWSLCDILSLILACFCSFLFFLKIIDLPTNFYLVFTLIMTMLYYLIIQLLQLSSHINRYLRVSNIIEYFLVVLIAGIFSGIMSALFFRIFSYRYIVFSILLGGLIISGSRVLWMIIYSTKFRQNVLEGKKNVLLIGAGDGGSVFMESYKRKSGNIKIVGIIDQDPKKKGLTIGGVKVLGGNEKIGSTISEYDVSEVIVAIPSMKPKAYEEILEICNEFKVNVYKMPKVEEVLLGIYRPQNQYKKVEISDLLGRPEIKLNEDKLRLEIEGKVIFVTGAGGSIGSEICRQIIKHNPKRIVLVGHGENSIYLIYHELLKMGTMTELVPTIADVQDYKRIIEIMNKEKPDIVYHAAAHKHVPLMEINPREAFKNNILGTYNVARAVNESKTPKMVMISTDKAVRPPNVMGATKRIAELIITGFNEVSESTYCAVRFGNVLGSRGSVIPVFEKQIEQGGPVTVTDYRMTRYFMTIPEASRLVIHAGEFAKDGEVFILDMGKPVKIVDLARKLILLSGHNETEIEIVESGIRPGEKLYEELLTSTELVENQIQEQIFIGKVATIPLNSIEKFINEVRNFDDRQMKEHIIDFANQSVK